MAKIGVTLDVLNQKGTPALYTDIFANRPTYGLPGRLFFSTDTSAIYEDTGSAWILIANVAGSGSVGTLEQVTTNGNTTDKGIIISANGLLTNEVIINNGTSSEFLKADGSLDSNTYVPYTGATGTVNLNAQQLTNVGALSGTSATFSSTVSVGSSSSDGLFNVNSSGYVNAYIESSSLANAAGINFKTAANSSSVWFLGKRDDGIGGTSAGNFMMTDGIGNLVYYVDNNRQMHINNAATFTSSVNSASSALQINPTNGYNLLIGTTTDAGYKLQVNGTASVTQIITDQTWLNASTFNQSFTISPANGAGTTIISNNSTNYTWTMEPAVSNNRMYILRTIGSNTITINTSGSDVIINNAGSSVSSLTMTSLTGAIILQSDGSSRWIQIK